jgi:hypothetical protein
MKTLAICCKSFYHSVKRAAGVVPLTAPPITLSTFPPGLLEGPNPSGGPGYDLIYFKLHGLTTQPYWYGDNMATALSASQILQANLKGATVFVANCHLDSSSPMLNALIAAGAGAVVGGSGANFAGVTQVYGADMLGLFFRRFLSASLPTRTSLALAKHRLRLGRQNRYIRDTLDFKLYTKGLPNV